MDPNILKEAMAAYQAVYNQEDVEHLDEMGQQGGRVTGSNPNVYKPAVTKSGPAGGGMNGMRGTGRYRNATQTSSSPGALRVKPSSEKPAPTPTEKPTPTPAAKPAAKPAATKPAAPVAKPAATPSAKVEPAKPAPRQKDTSITDMIGRSQIRQGAPINTGNKSSDIRSMATRGTDVGGSGSSTPKPAAPVNRATGSKKPGSIVSSFDMLSSSNVKGMIEAYADVYAPQEVDEALSGERIKKVIRKPGGTNYTRMHSADPAKRPSKRGGGGEKGVSKQSDFGAADRGAGNKAARRAGKSVEDTRYEEVDIFDLVLEFLQSEGFAETLEEAEFIMANDLNAQDIEAILEAMKEEGDEEDEKEMKNGKKSKKSEEDEDEEDDEEEDDDLKEASYSAKAARAGKDIGKPGKAFAKIAASAGKRYGSKERGEKVAGAILAKLRAKRG